MIKNQRTGRFVTTSARKPNEALLALRALIEEHYSGELWRAVHTGLAVTVSLSLQGRANPVCLIIEGASGRGKSTVINMFEPDRDETQKVLYRLDSFTSKSFVTHAANVKDDELSNIDLIPKLRDKVLLVKELAPLFRGREETLRENFSILTSVLDGRGYESASGVHGTRGYAGEYLFNWIGATTPIPSRTDAIMAQLGNRLLRYEIIGEEVTEAELVAFASGFNPKNIEGECRRLVNDFLAEHFLTYPVSSLDPKRFEIGEDWLLELVRWAKLIAQGRVELERTEDKMSSTFEFRQVAEPEGPQRIILGLRNILWGLAVLSGWFFEADSNPMETISHVAFSSIPRSRRLPLRALLLNGGKISSAEVESRLRISRVTAREYMAELAGTGLVDLTTSTGSGWSISLAKQWRWLLPASEEDAKQLPESEMQVCEAT